MEQSIKDKVRRPQRIANNSRMRVIETLREFEEQMGFAIKANDLVLMSELFIKMKRMAQFYIDILGDHEEDFLSPNARTRQF